MPGHRLPPPTWERALARLDDGLEADPAKGRRMWSGSGPSRVKGIIALAADADRAVRYLTKSIAGTYSGNGDALSGDPGYEAHTDRLHYEVRWLQCTPGCANWLRNGVQRKDGGLGLIPGQCPCPAHHRENLGPGVRRVLLSRKCSGSSDEHRADRVEVVRQTLVAAEIDAAQTHRCAADVLVDDGQLRFVWEDAQVHPRQYADVMLDAVAPRLESAVRDAQRVVGAGPLGLLGAVDGRRATTTPAATNAA